MRVPLTTRDFLVRAELVYADRIGIVDEPNQPAPSLGDVSYRDGLSTAIGEDDTIILLPAMAGGAVAGAAVARGTVAGGAR